MKQIWVKKVISSQPSIQSNLETFTAGEYLGVIETCQHESLLNPTCAASPSFSYPSAALPESLTTMATFLVNPLAFLPEGMTVDHGLADRKICTDLVVPSLNDKVIIAETSRFVPIQLREEMRVAVQGMIQEAWFVVRAVDDHPFGLGIFTLSDTLAADSVRGLTFEVDEEITVTFVRHAEAKNMRLTDFDRDTWIMFLAFPLDFQTTDYIESDVEDFGLLSVWHNPRGNNKYVLVKVKIVDPKFVPKSLVMHQLGGARHSWTVPVIMLRSADWNAHAHDLPPPPEDPAPEDGNPHPLYGPYVTAEQVYRQQLQAWFQQNAAPGHQYGHHHGMQHQMQQEVQLDPQQQQHLDQEEPQDIEVDMQPPLFNFQTLLAE